MKQYRIITILLLLSTFFVACDKQNLPYDLDGIEHGVVINIHKPSGTGAAMSTDMSDEFEILLDIPKQQGDWSMLKEAYLTVVYTHGDTKKSARVSGDPIKNFPCTLKIKSSDVCRDLGVTELSVGDRLEFTPSYILKSGTEVKGWTELMGFNNKLFTGWIMEDGTPFSYRISYTAFAPFIREKYQGDQILLDGYNTPVHVTQIDEYPADEWIPAGVSKDKLVGLQIDGDIWYGGDSIKMWINTMDFTLIIPDQVICPDYTYPYADLGTFDGQIAYCEGEVNTLNHSITFYFYSIWGQYSLGDATMGIIFQ